VCVCVCVCVCVDVRVCVCVYMCVCVSTTAELRSLFVRQASNGCVSISILLVSWLLCTEQRNDSTGCGGVAIADRKPRKGVEVAKPSTTAAHNVNAMGGLITNSTAATRVFTAK
jgi:hypothetical protein